MIQNPMVEIEMGNLMDLLKSKRTYDEAHNMAVQINIENGKTIISNYDLALIRTYYKKKESRDIRKEMIQGYLRWMNEKE